MRTTLERIEIGVRIVEAHPDTFELATTANDILRATSAGKIAAILGVEGTSGTGGSLPVVDIWHRSGVRVVTLCHNESLERVDSATDAAVSGGLSSRAEDLIRHLNYLGIVIDCAHASKAATSRALELSRAPIAISHSNAFSLCDHPRNVADDLLFGLKATEGSSWPLRACVP